MKNLEFLQAHEVHWVNKGEVVQIKVSTITELKEKIKAFEFLFETKARINFYTEPGLKTYTKDSDGFEFTYPILHSYIENIKSVNIKNKYIETDSGYNLIIDSEIEINLIITK